MRLTTVVFCAVTAAVFLMPAGFAVLTPQASSMDLTASAMKGGGRSPDLTVVDIWTSPDEPIGGQSATIYTQVRNIGTKDIRSTEFTNVLYIDGELAVSQTLTMLAAGAYGPIFSTTVTLEEGPHQLNGTADVYNEIANEASETNNERIEVIHWSSPSPVLFDFEVGPSSISDWTTVVNGNGVLEVVADPASESLYSLHISGGGATSTTRATSPGITEWDSYYDYAVTFKYYVTNSKWLVVYDDSRVVIEGRLADGLEAHLYAQIPYDPYWVDLGAVTHNAWHTIEIVVSVYAPAAYAVYIDGELRGEGISLLNSAPGYNTFTVGSRDPPGSKDTWNAYWDNICIEEW